MPSTTIHINDELLSKIDRVAIKRELSAGIALLSRHVKWH